MSGGSMNYIADSVENDCAGKMKDEELNQMVHDFVKVLHDCEWYDSSDIGEKEYRETVRKFKKRWFGKCDERLKEIIDAKVEQLRTELLETIGCGEVKQPDTDKYNFNRR